ncbi:MAG: metal ABC transporter permease [Desulfotomaculaceae bacterium]|nr:metal ABC transporter permease [Desulfotomaculaceae bacterium]
MIDALLEYKFLQNAVISAVLASIACGIIGTIVMEKRLVMMSGGIAHTAFGGIGMGYYLKIEPILGALAFSIFSSLTIIKIKRSTFTNPDILIGMFWSLGMAIGILFIAITPGYPPDMTSYLFGDILTVSRFDLWIISVLDVLVIITIVTLYNVFKAYMFDEEFVSVSGIRTSILEYLLFVLIAITVVILIRVVGIILVIALFTAPPAIAKLFTYNLKRIMLISTILGSAFCLIGLWFSYEMHISSGASIVLITVLSYVSISITRRMLKKEGRVHVTSGMVDIAENMQKG